MKFVCMVYPCQIYLCIDKKDFGFQMWKKISKLKLSIKILMTLTNCIFNVKLNRISKYYSEKINLMCIHNPLKNVCFN